MRQVYRVLLEQDFAQMPTWVVSEHLRQVSVYAVASGNSGPSDSLVEDAVQRALGGRWAVISASLVRREGIPPGRGIVVGKDGEPHLGTLETLPDPIAKIKRHDECSCPECDKSASIGDRCHLCHEHNCSDDDPRCDYDYRLAADQDKRDASSGYGEDWI